VLITNRTQNTNNHMPRVVQDSTVPRVHRQQNVSLHSIAQHRTIMVLQCLNIVSTLS